MGSLYSAVMALVKGSGTSYLRRAISMFSCVMESNALDQSKNRKCILPWCLSWRSRICLITKIGWAVDLCALKPYWVDLSLSSSP